MYLPQCMPIQKANVAFPAPNSQRQEHQKSKPWCNTFAFAEQLEVWGTSRAPSSCEVRSELRRQDTHCIHHCLANRHEHFLTPHTGCCCKAPQQHPSAKHLHWSHEPTLGPPEHRNWGAAFALLPHGPCVLPADPAPHQGLTEGAHNHLQPAGFSDKSVFWSYPGLHPTHCCNSITSRGMWGGWKKKPNKHRKMPENRRYTCHPHLPKLGTK